MALRVLCYFEFVLRCCLIFRRISAVSFAVVIILGVASFVVTFAALLVKDHFTGFVILDRIPQKTPEMVASVLNKYLDRMDIQEFSTSTMGKNSPEKVYEGAFSINDNCGRSTTDSERPGLSRQHEQTRKEGSIPN
jgi:hypothetical protein